MEYNVKRACIFQLILVAILSILILSVNNRRGRGGEFCLTEKPVKRDESYLSTVPKVFLHNYAFLYLFYHEYWVVYKFPCVLFSGIT